MEATDDMSCAASKYRVYMDLRKVLSLCSTIDSVGVIVMILIGHFHYGVILLQLPESFWFLFTHAN